MNDGCENNSDIFNFSIISFIHNLARAVFRENIVDIADDGKNDIRLK